MTEEQERRYFISYAATFERLITFGWTMIGRADPISGPGHIQEIEKEILQNRSHGMSPAQTPLAITVMSWQRFEDSDGVGQVPPARSAGG